MKTCAVCGQPFTARHRRYVYCSQPCRDEATKRFRQAKQASYSARYRARHPERYLELASTRYFARLREDPEFQTRVRDYARVQRERKKALGYSTNHGLLDLAEYEARFAAQGGVCGICGRAPYDLDRYGRVRKMAADHEHHTGIIRGLLCHRCNTAIGLLRDDPALLRAAAEYLDGHIEREAKREAADRMAEVLG